MVRLKDVSVSIANKNLFEGLSIAFEPNEHYVIQGANGSGKTTLLKIIAGVLLPKSGTVCYDFIDPSLDWEHQYSHRKKYIHFIPVHALHELVGSGDLFYQQRYYSIGDRTLPRVRDYFGESLQNLSNFRFPASLDISSLLDLELSRLSNGQIKKIIIIKQLLSDIPKILLMDYPFEGLDVESRSALSEFIDHLAETFSIQIILTDHYHELPRCISKKITLEGLKVKSIEPFTPEPLVLTRATKSPPPVTQNQPVVEVRDLKIQYGNKVIIKDLNWRINQGERWALTGKNGSGKTTLFSLIFADHPMAYSEKVYLFGKRRGSGESIWDIKKRINYFGPEQIHFLSIAHSAMTVNDYLNDQKIEKKSDLRALLSFFKIEKLLSKPMRHLSSGELQLVLIIMVFLTEKELLLLDEPFQFLDREQKMRVNEYLSHFLNPSITLVLITHYEGDIEKWTNHRLHL